MKRKDRRCIYVPDELWKPFLIMYQMKTSKRLRELILLDIETQNLKYEISKALQGKEK